MDTNSPTKAERLDALYRISMRLGTTLDLEELLNMVIDSVLQLTNAERGFIVLVNEWGRLRMRTARGVDTDNLKENDIPVSRTIVQRVIATGEPLLTSNAQDDARFADRASIIGFQFRSIMCAPLRARGRVNGAVFVDNRMLSGVFSEDDLELLSAFTNQAAMAIDNARLFQQTDSTLDRRVEELALFQRIDRDLHKSLDLYQTLDLVLTWSIRLTKAQVGAVGILIDDGEETHPGYVRLLVRTDEPDTAAIEYLLPDDHPSLSQVVTAERAIQTQNVPADQSIFGDFVAAQLAVPVRLDRETIGVIFLETNTVSRFLEEDIEVSTRLSDRAAVAIGNSRLHQELKVAVEDRDKFVSLMTHELRMPLNVIRSNADNILQNAENGISTDDIRSLRSIRQNAVRMGELLTNLSDLNEINAGRASFDIDQFNCGDVVQRLVDDFRVSYVHKKHEFRVHDPQEKIMANGDRQRVAKMLRFIIDNACKYTNDHGMIDISYRYERKDGEIFVRFDIDDNGVGMSQSDLQRAFLQFVRSNDPKVRDQPGWGMGLPVAQGYAEAMGGDISLHSEMGIGTKVIVRILRDFRP